MKTLTFLFLILAFSTSVPAQSNQTIEKELVRHIRKIAEMDPWDSTSRENDYERLNQLLRNSLMKYGRKESTLRYGFPELRKHLTIATSSDGTFRAYSWDSNAGGTMAFHETVFQFVGADGRVHTDYYREECCGDGGYRVVDISFFETGKEKYVIMFSRGAASSKFINEWVTFYRLNGNKLEPKPNMFKTMTRLTHEIHIQFDLFSMPDRDMKRLIRYDPKSQTIEIPIIINTEGYEEGYLSYSTKITGRFITYKFDGKYFARQPLNGEGKDL
jgi:hypothetical protein